LVNSKKISRLEIRVEFNCGFACRISLSSASLSDERGFAVPNNKSCLADFLCFFLINWVKFEQKGCKIVTWNVVKFLID